MEHGRGKPQPAGQKLQYFLARFLSADGQRAERRMGSGSFRQSAIPCKKMLRNSLAPATPEPASQIICY
jgi:hypothetical protein